MSQIYQKPPSSYTYLVGLANSIDFEVVPVTLTGVIADTLTQDLVIPGRTFAQDGQVVSCYSLLSTTSLNGGAPSLVKLNGTTIFSITPSVTAGSAAFVIESKIIRISPTALNCVTIIYSGLFVVTPPPANGVFSGSLIKLTGLDLTAQITIAYSSAVPNGGQNITQELCYCTIL